MKKSVIILETNPPSPVFDNTSAHASWFITYLSTLYPEVTFTTYQVFRDEFPTTENAVDGVIITGSSREAYDAEPWIGKLEQLVRDMRKKSIPLLGVCFGMQLIAQSAGGKVTKNPHGREIGTKQIHLTKVAREDPLFSSFSDHLSVQESHQSAVVDLPPDAVTLAENSYGIQAYRLKEEPVWGVQFHPEVTPEILTKVVTFRTPILESEGINAAACLREIGPTPEARTLLSNFMKVIYDDKND